MHDGEAVKRYKNRREARLGIATTHSYDSVAEYRKRRAERMGLSWDDIKKDKIYRKSKDGVKVEKKEVLKDLAHMDAPEDDEGGGNNNNKGGGGHGNTKLPFGLCMRYGIEIGAEWTPKDAWDALAGKGITADGAYARLKAGEDPGTPPVGGDEGAKVEEPEVPKDPVKTVKIDRYGGTEYGDLRGRYDPYVRRGEDKWKISATRIEGTGDGSYAPPWRTFTFHTEMDMYRWLKKMGVEEFTDPKTRETVNPSEMELPEPLFERGGVGYTAVTFGLRDGMYTVTVTDFDGKKKTVKEYSSLDGAKDFAAYYGLKEDDIKYSPALKKREAERVAWVTSDKKEWVDRGGIRYGDLRAEADDMGRYLLSMSTEDGTSQEEQLFHTKMEMIKYLKEQGVERAKVGKEFVNPQDFDIPETVATINGRDYQNLYFKADGDYIYFCGKDLDGYEKQLDYLYKHDKQTFDRFKELCLGGGLGVMIDEGAVTIDDDTKNAIEKRKEEERARKIRQEEFEARAVPFRGRKYADITMEKDPYGWGEYMLYGYDEDGDRRAITSGDRMGRLIERIKKEGMSPEDFIKDDEIREAYDKYQEFDKKAVDFGGRKYADIRLTKDGDGDYIVVGTDESGKEDRITSWYRDMYGVLEEIEDRSGGSIEPESIIQDDEIKKEYEDYKKRVAEFESKAVDFSGEKYADISIVGLGDDYAIGGYDKRGRKREIDRGKYKEIKEMVERVGLSFDNLPMDEKAKKQVEMQKKEEEAIASGEYSEYDGHAYKSFHVAPTFGDEYVILATGINDEQRVLIAKSYDDIIDELENRGITSYDILDYERKSKVGERPKNGIRKVRMLRTSSGEYKIMATTGKGTTGQVHSATSEEEARKWLRDNGVDDSKITTKGMNPNDDVPRTHTAKSLENYDKHRADREDDYPLLKKMSSDQKQEVVNMMTDVFDQGEFRMWRAGHFAEIVLDGFKNTLETGTSGGATGDSRRRYTEKEMFGLKGHRANEGEKYGYVGFGDDKDAFESHIASGYGKSYRSNGGLLFRFKKDAVGDRTTYTAGDSLDSYPDGRDRPLAGYAGSKPTYEGVSAMRPANFREVMKEYKRYKRGEISFNNFLEKFSEECQDGYVECHYHDKLTIDDVESVTMRKNNLIETFRNMSDDNRKKVFEKLKSSGVKLQSYDGRQINDGYQVLREELGLE